MDVCRLLIVVGLAYFVLGVATAWLYYGVRGDRHISVLVCIQPVGFLFYLAAWLGVVTRVYTRAVHVKSREIPGCTVEVHTCGNLAEARRMADNLLCVGVVRSPKQERISQPRARRTAEIRELELAISRF